MSGTTHQTTEDNSLSGELLMHTHVESMRCYQCGKCSAGCPMALDMEYPPSVVMRMLQTGDPELEDKLLRSYAIWVCVTCETCFARCPMEIDIPKVMDYLREKSLKMGISSPKAKHIIAFHRAFLDMIDKTGRMYELGLTVDYKMRSMTLGQDVGLAPGMMSRGKLGLFPEMIRDKKHIAGIFSKTIKRKEGGQ
ncbi:MAG: 4Fe-4S dicluster domain-containing protein [Bacteroidia bacterium]|nr:4Fe-4S dicluster domain-containing protein [Bacteroidia bacterium]